MKHHVTIAFNVDAVPAREKQQIPPPLQPLAAAKLAGLTVDVDSEIKVEAGLQYADDAAATAAEKAARAGIAMFREHLREMKKQAGKPLLEPATPSPATFRELPEAVGAYGILAMAGLYDEMLDQVPIVREGKNLVLRTKMPAQAVPTVPLAAAAAAAMFGIYTQRRMDMPGDMGLPGASEARPAAVPSKPAPKAVPKSIPPTTPDKP